MDEYTYEDCDDIVPSQDLVPSHNNHSNTTDDLDITHPAKRVKTTHEENDPLNQSDTQLSQLPDGVRKIPGPAGSLPPIHPTSVQSFPAKAVVLASQTEENSQEDGLLMQSKIHKKAPSVNSSGGIQQDEYTMDFIRGPWLVMLQNSELPPFGMHIHTSHTPLLLDSPTSTSHFIPLTNITRHLTISSEVQHRSYTGK